MSQDEGALRIDNIGRAEYVEKKVEAGVISVETSLLSELLEVVTWQQHELQALR